MKTRIITAAVGIAVAIAVIYLHNTIIYPLTASLIAALSVQEILAVCGCGFKRFPVHFIMCMVFAVMMPIFAYYDTPYIWRIFAATLIVFFMFAGYVADHKKLPFDKLSAMVTVTCLVTLSVTCLVSLKNISSVHGICYVVMALMAAWVPDSGAYFVGTAFGKTKLCPDISPKKTVEGAVGGLLVSGVVFVLYTMAYKAMMSRFFGVEFNVNYIAIAVIMVIAAAISMVGDLSASLLKREYQIKDFGKLLPGHGGMADRFDSVYFVLPYVMLVFNAFGDKLFY